MSEFYKISIFGIVLAVLFIVLKNIKPEFAVMVSLAGCCIILVLVTITIGDVIGAVKNLLSSQNIDIKHVELLLKVCGISFVCNFAVETCRDCGAGTIASVLETSGRICIVSSVLPFALSLLETVTDILNTNVF